MDRVTKSGSCHVRKGSRTIGIEIPIFPNDLGKPTNEQIKPINAWVELNNIFQELYDHDPLFAETVLNKYALGNHVVTHLPMEVKRKLKQEELL
jgi:hypothetical protein